MLHLPQNLEHWHSPAKPTYKGGRWGDQIEKLLYRGKYRNLRDFLSCIGWYALVERTSWLMYLLTNVSKKVSASFIHPLVLRKEDQAQLRLFRDRTDPQ
jgi:hypothetical protein